LVMRNFGKGLHQRLEGRRDVNEGPEMKKKDNPIEWKIDVENSWGRQNR